MIKQTPWIDRKFEFNFPVGLFPIILDRLRGTIWRAEELLKNVPEEKLSSKKDGNWSAKEIIGHLCDLEGLWNKRITDFLERKEVLTAADMTNAQTHNAGHNDQPVAELLSHFRKLRTALINRVKDLTEDEAAMTALHPRLQKPMRLTDSLFFAAEHDDHELAKLRALLENSW